MTRWERRPIGRPLLLGHRGASALCPENSLEAFQRAAADGADGVELDVLCCATGEVMVFHDDDLVRLGQGRADRIAEVPYGELRDLTLASGARIPTLEQALEACGPQLLVNIELKASGFGGGPIRPLVERVATIIADQRVASRVLVSSFHPRAVFQWMRRAPDVPAGLLFEREAPLPLRQGWAIPWLRPTGVHPEVVLCTPERVARWHRRGHLVNVWTVDDPAALRGLAAMGVDGIICNDPARARHALAAATSW